MTNQTAATVETRRRALMAERTVAIARRDWTAMNEITKRLAKLPVKIAGVQGVRYVTRID